MLILAPPGDYSVVLGGGAKRTVTFSKIPLNTASSEGNGACLTVFGCAMVYAVPWYGAGFPEIGAALVNGAEKAATGTKAMANYMPVSLRSKSRTRKVELGIGRDGGDLRCSARDRDCGVMD